MSTTELKKKLISKIKDTEDKNILHEVYQILNAEKKQLRYKLSPEQINAVREARVEIKKGKSLSNEQVDKEMEGWLNEK
ncbi:MAG: hypothetical protein SH857_03460 [Chitinophagales bacterium]|nr:hypothetical protein [Chitinophagales bacterium]